MNKKLKWLCLTPLLLTASSGLVSCSSDSSTLILRVINSEDYIYLQEDDESPEDMTIQFEKSDMVKEFLKGYPQYKRVQVIYDTSDTNETLYSELQTGKSNYDLMNVSDYMAQKIVSSKMAVPLYRTIDGDKYVKPSIDDPADYSLISNYNDYASEAIKDRLDQIKAPQKFYNKETKKMETRDDIYLKDYAVGYMWGTLGILFNPTYSAFSKIGEEQVIEDMQDFDTLWDSRYNGTISIKNSMRDTYALGLMHAYRDEFQVLKDKLDANEITEEEYQEQFSLIFNRSDEKSVNDVKKALDALKKNIFGLEVDSGKQDIITKKIGVNLAWSGDAVYSMDQANNDEQVTNVFDLYYSVPELGSNLWFDAWIMPDCSRSVAQYELAHLFLDFISDPANAAQNMEYTGYTSFIGGDSIIDLVRSWYDIRNSEVYYDDEYQIYALSAIDEVKAIDFNEDFFSSRDINRNEELLYYYVPTGDEPEDFFPTKDDLLNEETGFPVPLTDDEGNPVTDDQGDEIQKTYGDLLVVDDPDSEIERVDLTYFFEGTSLEEYVEGVDTIFYSDCYLPASSEGNISVGRQFFCQYPSRETLVRCAVMSDYGENNKYVMKMWENFKSDALPTWAIITFITLIVIGIAFVAVIATNTILKKRLIKRRSKNN